MKSDNTYQKPTSSFCLFDKNGNFRVGTFDANMFDVDEEKILAIENEIRKIEKAKKVTDDDLRHEFNM
jgi:hypothetical protein